MGLEKAKQLAFWLFMVLLVWAPLPLASNRIWSAMLLTMLSVGLLAAVLLVFAKKGAWPKVFTKARWVLLCFAVLVAWQLLQLLPLPGSVLSVASPQAAQFYQALGDSQAWAPLHISPSDGWQGVLQSLCYISAFMLGLLLLDTPKRIKIFTYTLILAASFQAVYGVYMVLSGFDYLFFVPKATGQSTATGTFVNRNHLAGYLNLGLALGVGLLLSQMQKGGEPQSWRENARNLIKLLLGEKTQLRLLLVIMVIGLVMTHSRMGNSAFVFALIVTSAIYTYKTRRITIKAVLFFVSIILVDAMVVGNWFGFKELIERIENTDIEKEQRYDMNINSMPLLKSFSVTGSGMESLPSVLPFYMQAPVHNPWVHAHNDYLELWISLGVIGFTALMLAAILIWRTAWQQKKPPYAVFMALAYIALHSSADFNLYITAFPFTLAAILATAFFTENSKQRQRSMGDASV